MTENKDFSKKSDFEKIFDLIIERLSIIEKIAWWKYLKDTPVYRDNREKKVCEKAQANAEKEGLPAEQIVSYFKRFMKFSVEIQEDLINGWTKSNEPKIESKEAKEKDLSRYAKEIDEIDKNLVEKLKAIRKSGKEILNEDLRKKLYEASKKFQHIDNYQLHIDSISKLLHQIFETK